MSAAEIGTTPEVTMVRWASKALGQGFTQVPNAVLLNPELSIGARLTFAVLARYAFMGDGARPGQVALGSVIGKTERQIRRYVDELVSAGLVSTTQLGCMRPNLYELHLPVLSDRTSMSGQDRTSASGLDRTPVSDEEEVKDEVPNGPSSVSRAPLSDNILRVTRRLAELMLVNDSKARVSPESPAWTDPVRLLLEHDGRSVDEVLAVVEWCQADEFERAVVLSPGKLRKRFGELLMKSKRKPAGQTTEQIRRTQQLRERQAQNAGTCCLASTIGPTQAEHEWRALAAGLRRTVGDSTFDIWLTTAHAHFGAEGELLVGVDEQVYGFVRDRFGHVMGGLADRRVEVVVCNQQGGAG